MAKIFLRQKLALYHARYALKKVNFDFSSSSYDEMSKSIQDLNIPAQ